MSITKKLIKACIVFQLFLGIGCSDEPVNDPVSNVSDSTNFIASISQVWVDSVNPLHKITLANVAGTSQVIGTDELLGDKGNINLQGFLNGFNIQFTVIIKYQPPNYNLWYLDYKGVLTDTSATHKRMILYSIIDTLYLKPN